MTPRSWVPYWRSVAWVVSIMLIAGVLYQAGRDNAETARESAARSALALCTLQAQGRVEDNSRYYVLVDFIRAAANARQDAAASEADPALRRVDLHAASDFLELLTRIRPLPIPDCSRLIN